MSSSTTNYGLILPAVNDPVDQDQWGTELNGDMSEIDSLLLTAMNFVTSVKTSTITVVAPTDGSSSTGSSKILFRCDASGGAFAANLPAATAAGTGFTVAFKKIDNTTNAVTITANGADTVDGASTLALATQYNWAILVCDGISAWDILSDTPSIQTISDKTISSNITGSTSAPAGNTLTAILDNIIGNTKGTIIYRDASIWQGLAPGSNGQLLQQASGIPSWATISTSQFTSQNVVTGSRSVGTVYQNTSGKTIFVTVTIAGNSLTIMVFSDSSSNPTTEIARMFTSGNSDYVPTSFMVLNNNYYTVSGGNIACWTEWS